MVSRTGANSAMAGSPVPTKVAAGFPMPREHGAWIILYVPLLIGAAIGGRLLDYRIALLACAAALAFTARNAWAVFFRRPANRAAGIWAVGLTAAFCVCAVPLFAVDRSASMIRLAALVVPFVMIYILLVAVKPKARLDRTAWGEIIGVGALTATGPAAYLISGGRRGTTAWLLWLACFLYFAGGVLYVKMWLAAVKCKRIWSYDVRRQTVAAHVAFTIVSVVVLGSFVWRLPGAAAGLMCIGYLPAMIRSTVGWKLLSPRAPAFKRVGLLEAALAIWFALFTVLAFRSAI